MDKTECEFYSEPETEEHIQGKIALYEWIKEQKGVTNAVLEGWISETKQRPDIMFTYNGELWVIEYQCSPIATEYVERHELYQAAGIHDIWICGKEKYLQSSMKSKFLEFKAVGFYDPTNKYYIDLNDKGIYSRTNFKTEKYRHSQGIFCGLPLKDFVFKKEIINIYVGDVKAAFDRRMLHLEYTPSKKKYQKNRYFKKQKELLTNKFVEKIESLSNKNWEFNVQTLLIGKRYKKCIIAGPVCLFANYDLDMRTDVIYNVLKNIEIGKFDFFAMKKYMSDTEYLKNLLLPIMQYNKQALLNYSSDHYRFLEVTHE